MDNSSNNTNECFICAEETSALYNCCPTETDMICESCWSYVISSIIGNGKIGMLVAGKANCDVCHKPIKKDRLPENIQTRISNILLTIPKTKTPQTIEEFNYSYNNSIELRNRLTDEKFIFISQRHYNLLGSCIDKYIQSLMKSDPWNYEEIWLPIKTENTDDHHDQVNIFVSSDFETNENGCLVLLQGSGVVRPGQWARSCCINETLNIGSMLPYMAKAKEHNLSVIILNPNQTSYNDKEPAMVQDEGVKNDEETVKNEEKNTTSQEQDTSIVNTASADTQVDTTATTRDSKEENSLNEEIVSFYVCSAPLPSLPTKKIPNLSTSREHVLYVYDNIIANCPAKKLYIVAHSAGGDGLMYLLRKRQDKILPTLAKIAFTDSVHSLSPFESNEIKSFLKANATHFVASDEPMGTPIDYAYDFSQHPACQEVSAGHPKHEYTSGYCVNGVFDFFFLSHSTSEDGIDKTQL